MNKNYEVIVLFNGFSLDSSNVMKANCSCTLIKGPQNIIVDTRTAWDGPQIVEALKTNGLTPDDIQYVVCTHGHSDHIGCNYLFQKAKHIVGYSISHEDHYFLSPDISNGEEYTINNQIKIISTPGHTLQDITVLFKNENGLMFAITGDLFEKEEDLENDNIWINAGSDSVDLQRKNRAKILQIADFIIPGHGPMFKVPEKYKVCLN